MILALFVIFLTKVNIKINLYISNDTDTRTHTQAITHKTMIQTELYTCTYIVRRRHSVRARVTHPPHFVVFILRRAPIGQLEGADFNPVNADVDTARRSRTRTTKRNAHVHVQCGIQCARARNFWMSY